MDRKWIDFYVLSLLRFVFRVSPPRVYDGVDRPSVPMLYSWGQWLLLRIKVINVKTKNTSVIGILYLVQLLIDNWPKYKKWYD